MKNIKVGEYWNVKYSNYIGPVLVKTATSTGTRSQKNG